MPDQFRCKQLLIGIFRRNHVFLPISLPKVVEKEYEYEMCPRIAFANIYLIPLSEKEDDPHSTIEELSKYFLNSFEIAIFFEPQGKEQKRSGHLRVSWIRAFPRLFHDTWMYVRPVEQLEL